MRGNPYTSALQVISSWEANCRTSGWHETMQKPHNSFRYLCGFQQWLPEPPGRQRTGTTWVVTMSTSQDTVLQCEYHYSPVDSQTKHWLWSLNTHKCAQRFSFTSAFSSPYWLGGYCKVRPDCFFILMNAHFLLLGQKFNIIWWKRLSPKGILLAVRDTLRFEGDIQCRQNSAEKDNLFLFLQLMTFT